VRAKEKLEVIDRIVSRLITSLEIDKANLIRIREIIKEKEKDAKGQKNISGKVKKRS